MQDDTCVVAGVTGRRFYIEALIDMNIGPDISFKIVGYDGLCLELQCNNGKTYLIESTYEDPLQCWELPTN